VFRKKKLIVFLISFFAKKVIGEGHKVAVRGGGRRLLATDSGWWWLSVAVNYLDLELGLRLDSYKIG
jgi:hypothetical protein